MSDDQTHNAHAKPESAEGTVVLSAPPKTRRLPLYKVILHNDDVNDVEFVAETVVMLTPLNDQDAVQRTLEAHHSGCALLLVIHKERAELYAEQFRTRNVTVTIEPDE